MSSRNTSTQRSRKLRNVLFMRCWNVAGALHRPMGSTVHSNRPWSVLNAVFSMSSGAMRIW